MAKKKGVFEADRKMELRLRLAAKRAADPGFHVKDSLIVGNPEASLLNKLIERVRDL
ncbi:MAG: hypothetical protein P8X64_07160 [Anaerolineales bacterium]